MAAAIGGEFGASNTKMNLNHSPNKVYRKVDGFQMEMRKLLIVYRPDYDDPVDNHEPQKPATGKT
ncbi:hypothetical protein SDJN02_26071, partial [Cucurbita argyrosperma subsp. argyrosperma]